MNKTILADGIEIIGREFLDEFWVVKDYRNSDKKRMTLHCHSSFKTNKEIAEFSVDLFERDHLIERILQRLNRR